MVEGIATTLRVENAATTNRVGSAAARRAFNY